MRTSVAVRSGFPKAIGMNMNGVNADRLKNDASAKSRKDYMENGMLYPVTSYTQVLWSTYKLRRESSAPHHSDGVNSGKLIYALVAARREPGAQEMKQSLP